jgi:hypothetical protein
MAAVAKEKFRIVNIGIRDKAKKNNHISTTKYVFGFFLYFLELFVC